MPARAGSGEDPLPASGCLHQVLGGREQRKEASSLESLTRALIPSQDPTHMTLPVPASQRPLLLPLSHWFKFGKGPKKSDHNTVCVLLGCEF